MQQMIEVRTAELEGAALDWAVALADGRDMGLLVPCGSRVQIFGMWSSGCTWAPTTDWAQGGPLIGRHELCLFSGQSGSESWRASFGELPYERPYSSGATPLIAACRAIVAAKLGDTVSVPSELMP